MVTYPKDWTDTTLGKLGNVKMCKRIFQSQTHPSGQIPFYKIGTFGGTADAYISRELYEAYKEDFPFPNQGDVLISAAGTIGRTVVYDGKDAYFQDSNIVWLDVNPDEVDRKFLMYFYQSYPWLNLEGTTISRLYNGIIQGTPIHLPPLPEQKAIAATLSAFDNHVANLAELIEKKKAIRDGALEDLVSGRTRLAGYTEPWSESCLGSIGTFTKGAPLSKAHISNTGTPFILYGELYTTYREVTYKVYRRTEESADEAHYSRVGDVIIPTSGETAEEIATACCVMIPGVILAGDLNIYRSPELDGRFLSYVIKHIVNQQISELSQGISIIHINAKTLKKIVVRYPKHEEQSAIADIIDTMDTEISVLEDERDKMTQIREGVMDDLLTGRVRLEA